MNKLFCMRSFPAKGKLFSTFLALSLLIHHYSAFISILLCAERPCLWHGRAQLWQRRCTFVLSELKRIIPVSSESQNLGLTIKDWNLVREMWAEKCVWGWRKELFKGRDLETVQRRVRDLVWLQHGLPIGKCNDRDLEIRLYRKVKGLHFWLGVGGGLVAKSCPAIAPHVVARQAPLSVGFSRQEYWSGLPLPSEAWNLSW